MVTYRALTAALLSVALALPAQARIDNPGGATARTDLGNAVLPAARENLKAAPHLATNAALLAASTADYPSGVWRDDFSAGLGAPPLYYTASSSACSLNSGNGDNGSQVKSADNKCWLAVFPNVYNVLQFGADPTNVADSAPAIQAALAAAAGREVNIPMGQYNVCSPITSSIPVHVSGMGRGSGPGSSAQSNNNVTQLRICSNNQSVFVITSVYPSHFHDFQIIAPVAFRPMIGGNGIELIGTGTANQANSVIERIGFTNYYNPIRLFQPAWVRIKDNYFDTWVNHAISCETSATTEASCGFISHNYIFGGFNTGGQGSAIYSEVGYADIHDNEILGGASNIEFNIKNRAAGWLKVHDNTIENCNNFCIRAQSADGNTAAYLQITGNEFSNTVRSTTMTAHIAVSVYLVGGIAQQWIRDIQISGNVLRSTTAATNKYIWIQSGVNVQVFNNLIDEMGPDNPTGVSLVGVTSNAGLGAPLMAHDNIILGTTNKYSFNSAVPTLLRDTTGTAFASLPVNTANGSQVFVTDGAPASSPCTGGSSTGSMAFRQNGAWKCF